MPKNKNKNRRPNPKGPQPKRPHPVKDVHPGEDGPHQEPDLMPAQVIADLTLFNTLPPTVLYVLSNGSTLNTPGLPDGLADGVRDLIVAALTADTPQEAPEEPAQEQNTPEPDEQPLPEHIDPETVAEPVLQDVTVRIPASIDTETISAEFTAIIQKHLQEGGPM